MRTRNASIHSRYKGLQGKCYKLWVYTECDQVLYELEKVWGVGTNCVLESGLTASEAKTLIKSMGLKKMR